ncbi:MAG: AAA-like domain-containing protein [Thermosynechococcaceae cyanobacterium]
MPTSQLETYKVGGSLGFNHPTYVMRQADTALLAALEAGQFCYVFNCRQMGKSSLRVQAMHQLRALGIHCVSIDMTVLGGQANPQQWYGGLMTQLWQGLQLVEAVNLKNWLLTHAHLNPVQQLNQFIEDILQVYCPNAEIVILLDEIDKVLSLDFSLDDFFALIRACYNQRADNTAYERLTFALFGVVAPANLIRDKAQTLFNIGQAIELTGFEFEEARPLANGLGARAEQPLAVLQQILDWTGGQPFLTQKLCQQIARSDLQIAAGQEATAVAMFVRSHLITHWESQDQPIHLRTIRDRINRNPQQLGQLLGLYETIWQQGQVPIDNSPEQSELRLSGLIVQAQDHLCLYNRIYREIFNQTWIDLTFSRLRPYASAISAWEASERTDESQLLQGSVLTAALQWSAGNSLSSQDYQFLAASQALDNRLALAAEREARQVQILETQLIAEKNAKQQLATAYQEAQRRLRLGSGVLVLSLVGALLSVSWLGYSWRQQRQSQAQALEWAGKSALRQFEFSQIDALITAMESSDALTTLVSPAQLRQDYPTTSPLTALQDILDQITERNRLEGHEASITSIRFSPSGTSLATASRDGTAKLWTIKGKPLATLKGHQGDVHSVDFSPDGQRIVTASKDGTARLWTLQGQLLATFLGHRGDVYNAVFSPDCQTIATASKDGTARLWTLQGKELRQFRRHRDSVYTVRFSPDGKTLATTSRDQTVKLWTLDGKELKTLKGHKGAVYDVSFHPSGQWLATASSDMQVKLWSLDGKELKTLQGHRRAVYDLSFSADGQKLATTSGDRTVKLWNVDQPRQATPLKTLTGHRGAVYTAEFSPNDHVLATAADDETIAHLWVLKPSVIPETTQRINSRSLSPNGQSMLTAWEKGIIQLTNRQGRLLHTFSAPAITSLVFSPDSQQFAAASRQGTVQIWTVQGQPIQTFSAHRDTIYQVQFSADGHRIATASRDGTAKLWTRQGQPLATFKGHRAAVYAVRISPDGQQVATASDDGTAKIWTAQGQPLATLTGHHGAVHDVDFSPDGQRVVTAASDGTARIWTRTGKPLKTLKHDSSLVYRATFSPDGQQLATGTKNGTVEIWDRQGKLRTAFTGHHDLIHSLQFLSNYQLLAIAQNDSQARLWPVQETPRERIHLLLNDGCLWLEDYFVSHPQARLEICHPVDSPELR